jgi:CxxC motif-containing protein (DUF1111 family)
LNSNSNLKLKPFPFVACFLFACTPASDPDAGALLAKPGQPLPGLDSAQLARFAAGQAIFHQEFTPEQGLGPLFNQRRCSSCHDLPTVGGSGVEPVTKATRFDGNACDLLTDEGGDVIQHRSTPALEKLGVMRERVPPRATAIVTLFAPPLYGAGLIETIPEETIIARADSADANGDGISGRVGRTPDGRIGRFGRKAEFNNLADFVAAAAVLELGLTSSTHPAEESINGSPSPPQADLASDPELDDVSIFLLVDYIRMLALPARDSFPNAVRDTLNRGERVFHDIACTNCHVPVTRTGPSGIAALSGKTVRLYSDFLLHDLGPMLPGSCRLAASPSEFRTAPLAGLRLRPLLLESGNRAGIEEAIRLHAGEAERSKQSFAMLPEESRRALLRWLYSL